MWLRGRTTIVETIEMDQIWDRFQKPLWKINVIQVGSWYSVDWSWAFKSRLMKWLDCHETPADSSAWPRYHVRSTSQSAPKNEGPCGMWKNQNGLSGADVDEIWGASCCITTGSLNMIFEPEPFVLLGWFDWFEIYLFALGAFDFDPMLYFTSWVVV